MANQYSDLFEYSSFAFLMNNSTLEYSNVTLLKDLCGKKAGTYIDKLVLNPANGNFTVARMRRANAVVAEAAKTLVEFKGVHTRFESESETSEKEPSPKRTRATTKKKPKTNTTVFKVYRGRSIHKIVDKDDEAFEEIVDKIDEILGGTDMLGGIITPDVCCVNDDGCIVVRGVWDEFDMKTRIKAGTYAFKRIA